MSFEARDNKLDEAMRRVNAAGHQTPQQQQPLSPPLGLGLADDNDSDANETDTGTFEEYKSTNPTPSNSPMLSMAKPLSTANNSSAPPASSLPAPLSISKSSPSTAAITPTSATAPAQSPTDENGMVGKAADTLVNSAKGFLGAIWGMGDGTAVATASR